ncbi:hypothetical protein RH831_00305 [Halodesulfurarchaeum sp. HSR-GB]|uniref:Membrane-spanning protein n=1 Tax=Halodesulfurarchaeum formicicum TaxID=1873524 RepID=A0A1J1AA36_9EURY|nr:MULTISPECIES: hypothetical protein [Halodesulfurarchaeum]APE95006.1 hypothetical protein HSR6_0544 [Halodesulfurarchaeum formicicum]MDR5655624.1 hypothetical protein [Halodesulfurarchaeum sp. HSR-GB]
MKIRERLGIDRKRQAQISRLMQLSLVGFLFVGLYEIDVGIIVNSTLGLVITTLPAIISRDYQLPMDPALTLWITAAVFLHTLGAVGLPGMEQNVYQSVWWWDHLTHMVSASLVAGAGYATVRALQGHVENVEFPRRFEFALIVVLVIAFGVLWEVAEFVIAELSLWLGAEPVLTQYGVGDTMLDLIFDVVGAVLVGILGSTRVDAMTAMLAGHLSRS